MPRVLEIENCADCPKHQVLRDPNPVDWFCGDYVKVFCQEARRNVTVVCRPYNVRKECEPIPDWCPLPKTK